MSLIFTRRVGEAFLIDDDVRVTVTQVGGGQVKVAIEAPAEVKVYREEIYNRIAADNAAEIVGA